MTPRIDDPVLRAQLVADIRERADAWHAQAVQSRSRAWGSTASDARACRLRAAVLEQLAHDLEDAARTVRADHQLGGRDGGMGRELAPEQFRAGRQSDRIAP